MGNSLRARILRRGLMEGVGLELLTAKIRSVEKNATFQPGKKIGKAENQADSGWSRVGVRHGGW